MISYFRVLLLLKGRTCIRYFVVMDSSLPISNDITLDIVGIC